MKEYLNNLDYNQVTNTVKVYITTSPIESVISLNYFKSIYAQIWYLEKFPLLRKELNIDENDVNVDEIPEELREILDYNLEVYFSGCLFTVSITGNDQIQGTFIFDTCRFEGGFYFPDCVFQGKIKIRECEFYDTDFQNTTFSDLADFWLCNFNLKLIFFKSDFKGTTVFADCTFKINVLFTYSLIDKLIIFRGSKFENGLDLSLSIGNGIINLFAAEIGDYATEEIVATDKEKIKKEYNSFVTEQAKIPLKNKRETFRILKQTLVSQGNISESIYYQVIEKETLRKELKLKEFVETVANEKRRWLKKRSFYTGKRLDRFNLRLNKVSNYYGKSYGRAFLFVLGFGLLFFYSSAIASNTYEMAWNLDCGTFSKGVGHFVQFLIPTHKFDYIGDLKDVSSWFYILDFFGRLFVGYGIYQFIQAFRKYR